MSEEHNQGLAVLVEETIRTLYEKGIAEADLAPLVKLHTALKAADKPQSAGASAPAPAPAPAVDVPSAPSGQYERNERRGTTEASDALMARVSAIIDVMVQGGESPEHASQVLTRQLLAVGVILPKTGGDARAWKRVYYWRNNLLHHKREGPAWDVYCEFKEKLANIPPAERMRVAVGEQLWNQRRRENSTQAIA
ncbi:MAG: hypothetical protein ACE5FM_10230 [Methyloligellaceae bacterium]